MSDTLAVAAAAEGLAATTRLLREARALLEELRTWVSAEEVPAHVLRTAFLDVELNLRLLDVVPGRGGAPEGDPAWFAYGPKLRLASLTALLLAWRDRNATLPARLFQKRSGFERAARQLEDMTLLGLARKALVAGETFLALADIPPEARSPSRLRTRLRNLRQWFLMLRAAMLELDEVRSVAGEAPPLRRR
jgi:hypothetical protein